ncbi:ent-kaurene oxidase 2 isoform X2 [Amborella trichopoda]|uniref:ent-kaurene oxidase 2 isoform X2 n=1 Tax=Amborella trichopoda TaxID=13333 RepID=UPI0009C005C0|nr:ent-kaurene oxidase 2 isoform X2 [Amborella trichopoda]|eukprot:XP_020528792.1 ent-kaurene oxidase 2 isoform X2 [Amborella trichopoda]
MVGFSLDNPLTVLATFAFALFSWFLFTRLFFSLSRKSSNAPPAVPGLPVLGNLLQLKSKKPHMTFTKWAEAYGPVYSIKTGATTLVVLNSTDVAKEKQHRFDRNTMIENMMQSLHDEVKDNPTGSICIRDIIKKELFTFSLKKALGRDVGSVYVEELGRTVSKWEIYDILVIEPMMGALEVDWRDFFPYLRWIPNRTVEERIQRMDFHKTAVMTALIQEQKKRFAMDEEKDCYLNFLLSEAKTLSEKQIITLTWEAIIEASDTTMVAAEWAMFELAKNPKLQNCLYDEIHKICGEDKLIEDVLHRLPYLNAVFHETLRKHSPVAIMPPRYVHEDTQIGGFTIPAGSEIALNLYGCNMNKNVWEKPEEWRPERFLNGKYEQMDLFKTMAFGGGKRVCAGALQAMTIVCTAIGRFVQEFEWRLNGEEEDTEELVLLTTHKLKPMQASITPRSKILQTYG